LIRILGIDPGLRITGWGVVEADGNRLRHVADGIVMTDSAASVPTRLRALHEALSALIALHRPQEAAVEETYVNTNATATLKRADAADALAVAICHAHHRASRNAWSRAAAQAVRA
jgi:crossover junction endodeoxyribonuclease RuvC